MFLSLIWRNKIISDGQIVDFFFLVNFVIL